MLLKPITNDRGTDIETLKELYESILNGENVIIYRNGLKADWRASGFDVKKYPFFDLAKTESEIDMTERAIEKLKARFNLVLKNLKY